jgi:hypothetical protein
MDSLLRGTDFLSKAPTAENISAHKIDTYIALLKSLITKGEKIPYNKRDEYVKPPPIPNTNAQKI